MTDDFGGPPLPVGDRRETLLALRDDLARRIPMAADRDAASLARQLSAVLVEIDELGNDQPAVSQLGAMLRAVPNN